MKTIFLVRHAKSANATEYMQDLERPLNERGHKEAAEMAGKLFAKKKDIDVFISSTAKRALSTCEYFTKIYGKENENTLKDLSLYEPLVSSFYKVIASLKNEFESAAIFSHNPAITYLVNELTANKIDDMPTCSIACIQAEAFNWQGFRDADKKLVYFMYP